MMKYIFCILFGSLLMLGFHYTPDEKVQEAQPNAGVVAMDVQSDTRLAQKISVTVAGQSYGGSHAFDSETSDYTISDGLLGGLFSFRNTTTPSKVLRFCSATIVQMLNFRKINGEDFLRIPIILNILTDTMSIH
jgi:hypothetical protein